MFKKRWTENIKLRKGVFWLLVILIWELASRSSFWDLAVFPSPQAVFQALIQGVQDQSFLIGTWMSVKRMVFGYALAVSFGVLIGLLMGAIKILDETLGALLVSLQSLPSICWLPLALLWFGMNEGAIFFVVVIGGLLPVAVATNNGVRQVPLRYIHAAKTFGATRVQLAIQVILPASLPSLITGLKQGWAFAWRALMAGELLFVSTGLGTLLQQGRELNDMGQVVAVMLVIVVLSMLVDRYLFDRIQNRVRVIWGAAI